MADVADASDGMADAELVRLIAARAAGARAAEAELCRRYAPRIRLYGLRHLRNEEGAREVVQTVLLAVLVAARAGRVEDPALIDRFILGTCRNTTARLRELDARATPTAEAGLDVGVVTHEPEMIETGALVRCLAALDARARAVVELSFRAERSTEEIAATLATTAGNVRVLRHRAIASLRRCLDGDPRAEASS